MRIFSNNQLLLELTTKLVNENESLSKNGFKENSKSLLRYILHCDMIGKPVYKHCWKVFFALRRLTKIQKKSY